ncbi:hypothetical protein [Sphingomonas dokdonensis]|uniref:Uncharacterized protein n=1 Tax=Sphingomonas dokdonensis TaxID=344880 RepID=A0A245ZTW0_9SPHN|nr:hypothetical protein [Sphingomonas dokdonensis]OWK33176.1 hypothetical protein SPDO_00500 [Sphingomonas dokdonensis]
MHDVGETMTMRATVGWGLLGGLALAVSGCATAPAPVKPPPVVATLPPPPTMPAGGYIGMKSAPKRADGRYITPNLDNTDQAAVWHLRNALNVAALGCDQAGGGVIEPYNAWINTRAAVIDRYYQAYIKEWQTTGWGDWQRVYDDNQTRIYNFYAQPAMRKAFCAIAREEVAQVGQVADADLPAFARASLLRLDRPFTEFYAAYDAWRDYYQPVVKAPPAAQTTAIPVVVPPPAAVASPGGAGVAPTGVAPAAAPADVAVGAPAAAAPISDEEVIVAPAAPAAMPSEDMVVAPALSAPAASEDMVVAPVLSAPAAGNAPTTATTPPQG